MTSTIEIKDATGEVIAATGIDNGERFFYYGDRVELIGQRGNQSLFRVHGGEDYLLFTSGLAGGLSPASALDAALWLS